MAYIAIPHPISYTGANVVNPLLEEKELKEVKYDEKTYQYLNYLTTRLTRARDNRDQALPEWGGKTYTQQYEENEKIANTIVDAPKNKTEKPLATGTIEAKMNALLAHVNNLNLTPIVYAYDKHNRQLHDLGVAFTDIMEVTAEHDGGDDGGDKEKRLMRQRELLKQGTVFIQENYLTKYQIRKQLKKAFAGEFKNFAGYDEKLVKVFEGCSRDLLYGLNVYLGDITAYSQHDQPYLFTVEQSSYDQAKTIYGKFDNWQFVRPGMPSAPTTDQSSMVGGRTIFDAKFRLTNIKDDHVEIIKYQDEPNDEWALIINGVLLTPAGFPLSAVTPAGKYNVTKQVLYPINAQFAYGKSFVSSGAVYELSRALDEMLRLFELKTRKSVTVPYVNITNRIIPPEVLNPGNISMGIPPNALQPIGTEGQGVTSSEFQIFKELQSNIENSTVSAVFQGQQAKSGATATEIVEVQRQAKLTLGLIVSACILLEQKIAYLRLWNIIGNWLNDIGIDPSGKKMYRRASRRTSIDGSGMGERQIIPIDGELPTPEVVRMLSLEEEIKLNMPVRRSYLSPTALREAQLKWHIIVEPREEETSAYQTVKFREMVGDILSLMQLGATPNVDGLTDEISKVYNKDKSKMFGEMPAPAAQPPQDPATAAGNRAAGNGTPRPYGQPTAAPDGMMAG